jgi:hypothetical protein
MNLPRSYRERYLYVLEYFLSGAISNIGTIGERQTGAGESAERGGMAEPWQRHGSRQRIATSVREWELEGVMESFFFIILYTYILIKSFFDVQH